MLNILKNIKLVIVLTFVCIFMCILTFLSFINPELLFIHSFCTTITKKENNASLKKYNHLTAFHSQHTSDNGSDNRK